MYHLLYRETHSSVTVSVWWRLHSKIEVLVKQRQSQFGPACCLTFPFPLPSHSPTHSASHCRVIKRN